MKRLQIANELYTFKSKKFANIEVILPDYGVTNDLVVWNKYRKSWAPRQYAYARTKVWGAVDGSKSGMLGRMRKLITSARHNSERFNHSPIRETPECMIEQWKKQNNLCAACGSLLDFLKANYHHSHETGEGFGFLHPSCNAAEGHLKSLSPEAKKKFMRFILGEK